MPNTTKIVLLVVLALAAIVAISCGDVEIEKEVQIGEPVIVEGLTNKQLRSPEFKDCMQFLLYGHRHFVYDSDTHPPRTRDSSLFEQHGGWGVTSGVDVNPVPTPSGMRWIRPTPVPKEGYEECVELFAPQDDVAENLFLPVIEKFVSTPNNWSANTCVDEGFSEICGIFNVSGWHENELDIRQMTVPFDSDCYKQAKLDENLPAACREFIPHHFLSH